MTQLTELDYETIENAVMETARGRWFLSEYKKRHSTPETSTTALLDAINRLEKVVTAISHDLPPQPVKKTIRVSPPAKPAPAKAKTKPEVKPAHQEKTKPLGKENLQFFAKDEDLFADDVSTLMPDALNKEKKPEAAGKRFKVFKQDPEQENKTTEKPVDQNVAKVAGDSKVPDLAMQPTEEERDRIVVIRNSAGDDIDIPLADELQEETPDRRSKQTPA